MTTQTEEEKGKAAAEGYNPFEILWGERKSATAVDWAVLGCLAAGVVGLIKAYEMENAGAVLVCLVGAVAAFGVVFYVHLRKP